MYHAAKGQYFVLRRTAEVVVRLAQKIMQIHEVEYGVQHAKDRMVRINKRSVLPLLLLLLLRLRQVTTKRLVVVVAGTHITYQEEYE